MLGLSPLFSEAPVLHSIRVSRSVVGSPSKGTWNHTDSITLPKQCRVSFINEPLRLFVSHLVSCSFIELSLFLVLGLHTVSRLCCWKLCSQARPARAASGLFPASCVDGAGLNFFKALVLWSLTEATGPSNATSRHALIKPCLI